jgi:hypothetical protein
MKLHIAYISILHIDKIKNTQIFEKKTQDVTKMYIH